MSSDCRVIITAEALADFQAIDEENNGVSTALVRPQTAGVDPRLRTEASPDGK
jgi:formylmethanofuran:tetrahydromethanopterin formyltransferase